MSLPLLSVQIATEPDIVVARQRARQLAQLVGFDAQDQARIATALSEIARNVHQYAGGGTVQFAVEGRTAPQVLTIVVSDRGPGIAKLDEILAGRYRSPTGMGLGILGARRLMDRMDVQPRRGGGTVVSLAKILPAGRPPIGPDGLSRILAALEREGLQNPLAEVQHQNQQLMRALEELQRRQLELERLNGELEDTNRGVVALYAELDEKAEHLRRADDMKSRFLSNMSHEFRTPLNSILAISRLLLDRTDGELTTEQERQVGFVRKAAQDLTDLVNDLLDLAKVEAGKIVVRPAEFEVGNLFGALRGMLRPLLVTESVSLVFEDPEGLPPLVSDESKVSQILRNFISNALKFTERGEVRVGARADREHVVFWVKDTGIGIDPADHARIFQEFGQVDSPVQRKVRGTGLGLPLSSKLADLLGGAIELTSALGQGSTFSLRIPMLHPSTCVAAEPPLPVRSRRAAVPVLVVEDSAEERYVHERVLAGSIYEPVFARTLREARERLLDAHPRAVVLDIQLFGEDTWTFLGRIRTQPETRSLPVIVVTNVDDRQKALALGADAYAAKPVEREWLIARLDALVRPPGMLIVDDEESFRYTLEHLLGRLSVTTRSAGNGSDGLRAVREQRPAAILLDLGLPQVDGFEVLETLRADPETETIPVVVVTSRSLGAADYERLQRLRASVVSKSVLGGESATADVRAALERAGWRSSRLRHEEAERR